MDKNGMNDTFKMVMKIFTDGIKCSSDDIERSCSVKDALVDQPFPVVFDVLKKLNKTCEDNGVKLFDINSLGDMSIDKLALYIDQKRSKNRAA